MERRAPAIVTVRPVFCLVQYRLPRWVKFCSGKEVPRRDRPTWSPALLWTRRRPAPARCSARVPNGGGIAAEKLNGPLCWRPAELAAFRGRRHARRSPRTGTRPPWCYRAALGCGRWTRRDIKPGSTSTCPDPRASVGAVVVERSCPLGDLLIGPALLWNRLQVIGPPATLGELALLEPVSALSADLGVVNDCGPATVLAIEEVNDCHHRNLQAPPWGQWEAPASAAQRQYPCRRRGTEAVETSGTKPMTGRPERLWLSALGGGNLSPQCGG